MKTCLAKLENDILTLGNDLICRRYRWNGGHLISESIEDKIKRLRWDLNHGEPDCAFPGEQGKVRDGQLTVTQYPADSITPAHLQAEVCFTLNSLHVKQVFRLYPDCPAFACDFYLRGASEAEWRNREFAGKDMADFDNLLAAESGALPAVTMERFSLNRQHVRLRCVRFFDVTDRRNNLVSDESFLPYGHPGYHKGNLILAVRTLDDAGFFILKESSYSDVQTAYPGCDFICSADEVRLVGLGVDADDLDETEWVRGYGYVTGLAHGGESALLEALRVYQAKVRLHRGRRDHMLLLNTWGDRGQDGRISESFALRELEAGAKLGITHFQLDDGWQKGLSPASVNSGGSFDTIWDSDDYWDIHPERFPNGLEPVVEKARELGIELGLWFNPSFKDSFKHWKDDADVLIRYCKTYGIRTFKIDGVEISDKMADRNLRAMFDRVISECGQEIVFNLDGTAGHRFGCLYFNEYGNFFLENRYTDNSSYYPHWTLRNLWRLSRYLPPQNLQIEFLNKWRNGEKYSAGDPLAPENVPFGYCFGVTMMAQPLAWFEASNLPDEAFDIAGLVKAYIEIQEKIHAGQIFPIGEEPSGASWTGFQSICGDCGYFTVYREQTSRPLAPLTVLNLNGRRVHCRAILGQGTDFAGTVDEQGQLSFALPEPLNFAIYEYTVQQ